MALTKKSNRRNQPNKCPRLIPVKSYHLAVPPKLALVIGLRPRPGGHQVQGDDEDDDYDSLFGSPVIIYTGQEEHDLQSPPQELLKRRRRLYVPARVVGGRLILCRSKSVYVRKARPLSNAPADFAFYHPTVPYMAAAPVFVDNLAQYFVPMQASEQAYPFDFQANIVPMDDITASSDLESFDMATDEDAKMMDSFQCKGNRPTEDVNMASPQIDLDINPFRSFHSGHNINGLSSPQVVVVDQTASQTLDGVQELSGNDMETVTKPSFDEHPTHEVDSLALLLSGLSISEELTTPCPSLESDLELIPVAWDDVKDECDAFLSVEGRGQHEDGIYLEEIEREEQEDLIDFESEVLLPIASSLDKESLATRDQLEVMPSNLAEDPAVCPSGPECDVTIPAEPEYGPVPVPVVAASEHAEADKDETLSRPQPSRPAYRRVAAVSNYPPTGCHAMRSKLFVRLPVLEEVLKRQPRIFVQPNNRFKSDNMSKFHVKANKVKPSLADKPSNEAVKTEGPSLPKAGNYPPVILLPDSPIHSNLLRTPISSNLSSKSSTPKQPPGKVLLWNTSSKMDPPSKSRSAIPAPARFSPASTRVSRRAANYLAPLSSSTTRTTASPPAISTVNVYSHTPQARVEPPKASLFQKVKKWFTPSNWWV